MTGLPPDGRPNRRRPSMKGALMSDLSRQTERVRAWPRKRGTTLSPATREANEQFRQWQIASKYQDPRISADDWVATQASPLLPRDIRTMFLSGTIFSFTDETGRTRYPLPYSLKVSESLDALSQTEGSYLWRGPERWEAGIPSSPNSGGTELRRNTPWGVSAPNVFQPIPFDFQFRNTAVLWDAADPTKIVADITGQYTVTFSAQNLNTGGSSALWGIYRGGDIIASQTYQEATSSIMNWQQVVANMHLVAGEEVTVRLNQNSTARQWSYARCEVSRI